MPSWLGVGPKAGSVPTAPMELESQMGGRVIPNTLPVFEQSMVGNSATVGIRQSQCPAKQPVTSVEVRAAPKKGSFSLARKSVNTFPSGFEGVLDH